MKLEDDRHADETSGEDEDELPEERRGLKDLWERDEEKESWDEDEDEHEDEAATVDDDDDDDDYEDEDEDDSSNITHGSSLHFGLLSFFLVLSAISFHFYLNVWA